MALGFAFVVGRWSASWEESGEAEMAGAKVRPQDNGGSLLGERAAPRLGNDGAERDLELLGDSEMGERVRVEDLRLARDPLKRVALLGQLLEGMTAENAKAVFLEWQASQVGRLSEEESNERRLLLMAWGRLDGAAAAMEVSQLIEDGGLRERKQRRGGEKAEAAGLLGDVLEGWAGADLAGASAYVAEVSDRVVQGGLQRRVVEGLLSKGEDEAMRYVASLPETDKQRGRLVGLVTSDMLEREGVKAAAKWMEGLSDELRAGAVVEIAEAYAREDLDEAIVWASQHATDGPARKALGKVTGRWANVDPRAASEYLAELPDSAGKDAAVDGFAKRLAVEDPESAALWATTIQDERLRAKALGRIATSWAAIDREAAGAWLASQGLPNELLGGRVCAKSQLSGKGQKKSKGKK